MKVLLYAYFCNIPLDILRLTFSKIIFLFSHSPNIGRIGVKVGSKVNYFSYFMSSYSRFSIVIFSLISFSQSRDKQKHARDFALSIFFWIISSIVLMQKCFQNSSNYCNEKWMTLVRKNADIFLCAAVC